MIKIPKIKVNVVYENQVKYSDMVTLTSPDQTADLLRSLFDGDTLMWTEECVMLCLNRANKIIGYYKISSGGTSAAVVDPKVIFTTAINCTASSIILAHNHPSGNLTASHADKELTKKIKSAGELLDIKLLDHIILTSEGYISMADEGLV